MGTAEDEDPGVARPRTGPHLFAVTGASNLSFGLPALASTLVRRLEPAPVEIHAAAGPGRSYGIVAGGLGNVYPGIVGCGILEAVEAAAGGFPLRGGPQGPPAEGAGGAAPAQGSVSPRTALLMDIGNDILYGIPVEEIIGWIDTMVGSWRRLGFRILILRLPSRAAKRMSRIWFAILRAIIFPGSRITLEEVSRAIGRLNGYLDTLPPLGVELVDVYDRHAGLDRIHFAWRHLGRAWSAIVASLLGGPPDLGGPPAVTGREVFRLWRLFWRRDPIFAPEGARVRRVGRGGRLSLY